MSQTETTKDQPLAQAPSSSSSSTKERLSSADPAVSWSFVIINFVLVFSLGAYIASSLFSPPADARAPIIRHAGATREIASLQPLNDIQSLSSSHETLAKAIVVECLDAKDTKELQPFARMVRIQGQFCLTKIQNNPDVQYEIENLHTGLRAMVFRMPSGQITSDFIDLTPGINQVSVRAILKGEIVAQTKLRILN